MAMDGLTLAAAVVEARALTGGRIDKIQQPDRDELALSVRAGGENYRLLLCASPERCRVQLTSQKGENPLEPPAFCMLLRKRLTGGRITAIEQPDMDRRVDIVIEAENELGDMVPYILSAEIMGKYSNIILINEKGVVLDAIRRVGLGMSNVRAIIPGAEYLPPPSQEGKRNPAAASQADFEAALSGTGRIGRALSSAFFGLSPRMAESLAACYTGREQCQELSDEERSSLAAALRRYYDELLSGAAPAALAIAGGRITGVYPFIPAGMEYRAMPSISQALDAYYAELDVAERMRRRGSSIRKTLQNGLERCHKKLALYDEAINSEGDIEKLRLYGELITANLHAIPQGAAEAVAENYYADPPEKLIIPLEPRCTPSENAQRYYKKYQKAKAARDMAQAQRTQALAELEYLEGQLDNLDKCTLDGELREIHEELIQEGYIKPPKERKKGQKSPASKPLCYISSDGIEIYVGKNNRQNDTLTLKLAGPSDIWMHTKDIPGSHVIIRASDPPKPTLYEGALLAAWYSRARGGAQVPVDYTPRRYVKKPSGAKPGMVIYTTNKTAYVTPTEEELAKLRLKK